MIKNLRGSLTKDPTQIIGPYVGGTKKTTRKYKRLDKRKKKRRLSTPHPQESDKKRRR